MKGRQVLGLFLQIGLIMGCSEEEPILQNPNPNPPPSAPAVCVVDEMEFRNGDDVITGIREFNYNINQGNRLESITIVEGFDQVPLTVRFELRYGDGDAKGILNQMNEVFDGDVVTNTLFKYNSDGNLIEFVYSGLSEPYIAPPEFQVFFYEESELANDSINSRIIVFDIDRLTRDWIDVLPAVFTTGGQRITRFESQSFRGDIQYGCDFSYDSQGFLVYVECRSGDGILTQVWDFTYEDNRLISAFRQDPNFRALRNYEYDDEGKPRFVISTINGFFNWRAAYFYSCQ